MAAVGLAIPLQILSAKSLSSGAFFNTLELSLVRPIHKAGDKTDVRNYCPIAIINSIPKFFEKIVAGTLRPVIDPILVDKQHGFRKGRFTATNLTLLNDNIFTNLDFERQIDAIYADFAKAVDRENHQVLISKLTEIGFRGTLLY